MTNTLEIRVKKDGQSCSAITKRSSSVYKYDDIRLYPEFNFKRCGFRSEKNIKEVKRKFRTSPYTDVK